MMDIAHHYTQHTITVQPITMIHTDTVIVILIVQLIVIVMVLDIATRRLVHMIQNAVIINTVLVDIAIVV